MDTDQFIRTLVADGTHRTKPVWLVLAATLLAAAPVSICFFLWKLGLRSDVMTAMHNPFFDLKFVITLSLTGSAIAVSLRLSRPEASLHFDMQYERVPFPERARPGFERPISFTLPLVLPRRGGGLTTFDVTLEQINAFYLRTGSSVTLDDLTPLLRPAYHPYEPGTLVLHSGHMLHRIAPVSAVDPDDERITLQGHGVFYDGEWKLYW